jgi:hypothetical protein
MDWISVYFWAIGLRQAMRSLCQQESLLREKGGGKTALVCFEVAF